MIQRFILLIVTLLSASMSAQANPMVDPNTPAGVMPASGGTNWTLDFSDEFSGASLDTTKWGIDVSTSSRAARADRGIDDWWWKTANVSLDGAGKLKLDVVKHDANTMYCGSVSSDGKYEPTYGYMEARIQIADTTKDTHTAFWLQGSNMGNVDGTANDGAEVDIFESAWFGDYTKSVVHIDGYGADHQASTKQYTTPNLHSGYHVFGMEWTADYLKIYYDGNLKATYTGKWVPRVQEWLWLSCGASFGDIGTFQSEPNGYLTSSYIDYVRVWKAPPDTTGPVISSLSPSDNATGVVAGSQLVINFNESIVAGSGLITIKNLTDATQSTINITDGSQVSMDYLKLTITPTTGLLVGKNYAIQIASTALDDLAGNSFAGIGNDTTWNFSVASSFDPVVLVGGTILNGNFNANPGASMTFSETAAWYNTKGAQTQVATRSDVAYDGTQNGTLTVGRGFGVDTGYAIVEGHAYDISYVWKDDFDWNDGTDQVTVSLFVTHNNTITGTRTNLVTRSSGTSNTNTYVSVSQDAIHTASAIHAGKVLFAAIETTSSGFARIDNFQLVMKPPSRFSTWMSGFSLGSQTAPSDDPDGDTMSNWMEYALGVDPSVNDVGPLSVDGSVNGVPLIHTTDGGASFDLVFVRRDDHGNSGSASYTPQFSSDLITFYDSTATPTLVADSTDDPNYEMVKVPYPTSLPNGQPARFGRIRAEAAP